MIQHFKCEDTERLFNFQVVRRWDAGTKKTALRKLKWLHAAVSVNDLRIPPGNRLEKLRGNRKGQYSIRVNDQWRICFAWNEGHATDVEIVDYH